VIVNDVEFNSPNDLGKVLSARSDGKMTIIVREYGIEKFIACVDPRKTKLEVMATFPRKIIDLRQAKYQLKRRGRHGGNIIERRATTTTE